MVATPNQTDIYAYIHIHIHTHGYIYIYIYMYICTHICVHFLTYIGVTGTSLQSISKALVCNPNHVCVYTYIHRHVPTVKFGRLT
jgi:hypothetical protein